VTVWVRIAAPEDVDSGFRQPVQSVVIIETDEPVSNITSCYVSGQGRGGTVSLGHQPFQVMTRVWRIRSEYLLRSVRDVIIGYRRTDSGRKSQWFQWDGYELETDPDESCHDALLHIQEAMKADGLPRRRFGFTKD
jgi:hypothetical protein